jgi:hypothetical protein
MKVKKLDQIAAVMKKKRGGQTAAEIHGALQSAHPESTFVLQSVRAMLIYGNNRGRWIRIREGVYALKGQDSPTAATKEEAGTISV